MILSLDANVLIDLANGRRPAVRRRFDAARHAGDQLLTCSICAHELLFGAQISRSRQLQTDAARALLAGLKVAEFSFEDAAAVADLREALRGQGWTIGAFDTLIAGQALSRGWTVVTGNIREFARVPNLELIDWTASPDLP